MTFMDSLGENSSNTPNSSNNIYGQPEPTSDKDVLSVVNRLKDREMQDFKDKANFMSDLSLNQELRMRNLYDPEKHKNPQDMPVTSVTPGDINSGADLSDTRSGITGPQKAELGIRQQGFNLESQKLAQQGKLGQESIDVRTAQEKLNQQKSDQANVAKQADMQRKIDESNKKIELAQQALQLKTDNADAQLQAHKDMAAAVEERHKLELAMKQHQFDVASEQHDKAIKAMEERLKQSGSSTTTTEINPEGNRKTVTTKKGDASETINVIGKDGKRYTIPKDKLDDKDEDGTPHWKAVGGE